MIVFLFFSYYLFGQWGPECKIAGSTTYADYGSYNNGWTIAVKDSFVHMVWEHRPSTSSIGKPGYVHSTDYGSNFSLIKNVPAKDAHNPHICVSDSFVHVVWPDKQVGTIYYNRSSDYGVSWGSDFRITNDSNMFVSPSICCGNSFVHIVWVGISYYTYYNRSSDYGVSWDFDNFKLTNDSVLSFVSSICCVDSFVHIVYLASDMICYNRSSDYGVSWDIDNFGITDISAPRSPSICCIDSFVHVIWVDGRDGNPEIYYNRSSNYGVSWDFDFRLTNDLAGSESPSICCMDSAVNVVWVDERDGNPEIYYKKSSDYGLSWSLDERLTTSGKADFPSIACTKCPYDVHVMWTASGIYYKRHKCEVAGVKEGTELPTLFVLSQNHPNPCREATTIKYQLPKSIHTTLRIYNVTGQLVKTLVNEEKESGNYTVTWDGKNNKGRTVTNGIYFYKLTAEDFTSAKKLFLMK